MKKIMLALAVVATVAIAQAGAFKWSTNMGQAIYLPDSTTKLSTGTAYLFDGNTYAVTTLLDAFVGSGIDFSKSLSNKAVGSGGTIGSTTTSDVTAGQTYDLYFAVVNGDNVFVSEVNSKEGPDGAKTTTVAFSPTTPSKGSVVQWTAGGSSATSGWYTAAPEPTSGLLLLLGMAGLALRRRRA